MLFALCNCTMNFQKIRFCFKNKIILAIMTFTAVAWLKTIFKTPKKSFDFTFNPAFFDQLSKYSILRQFTLLDVPSWQKIKTDGKVKSLAQQNVILIDNN